MDLKGNFANAMPVMEKLLDVKGNILPLTEDNVNLVGITSNGKKVIGEYQLTKCASKIVEVKYDKDITVNPKVIKAVNEADLIIFSSGSLLTSVVPHLIDKGLVNIINKAKAEKVYICNLFTQPGETDDFTVKDHIDYIEKYALSITEYLKDSFLVFYFLLYAFLQKSLIIGFYKKIFYNY